MILSTIAEQLLMSQIEAELLSHEGAGPLLWIYIGLSALMSVILPVVSFLFIVAALGSKPVISTFLENLEQLVIENLRALGKELLWGFLFILPGVMKYVQYSFINFIVLLDPDYQVGERDALATSQKLVNKRFFRVFSLVILFMLITPLFFAAFDEYSVFFMHPFSAVVIAAAETLTSILFVLLLLRQWESAHGTHV
jgi:hypothetical protein